MFVGVGGGRGMNWSPDETIVHERLEPRVKQYSERTEVAHS